MKSRKLMLYDSLIEDQVKVVHTRMDAGNRTTLPPGSKVKRINVEIVIPEELDGSDSNNQIVKCTPKVGKADLQRIRDDSGSSDYEFNSSIKISQRFIKGSFPRLTSLKIGNDSNLTIKTKKSSKFSLKPQNSAEKTDKCDGKGIPSFYEPNRRESTFKLESQLPESAFTVRKLTTPQSSTNCAKKRSFKFDFVTLNNENDNPRTVYPHSCKNAHNPLVFEVIEPGAPQFQNLNFEEANKLRVNEIRPSTLVLPEQLQSMATLSKRSDKSENESVHINQVAKLVQAYEIKIDRLLQDQKFKIASYKRLLEDKDKHLNDTKADLDSLRSRYAQLVESLAAQTKVNEHYLVIIQELSDEKKNKEHGLIENIASTRLLNDENGTSTLLDSILKIKKSGETNKNGETSVFGLAMNLPNAGGYSNRKAPETHMGRGDAFNLNGFKKTGATDNFKKTTDSLFYSAHLKSSPTKTKRIIDKIDGLSHSKVTNVISPVKKKVKGSFNTNPISAKNIKTQLDSSKKNKEDYNPIKRRFEGSITSDFKNSKGFSNNFPDPVHQKKENLLKTSFVSKVSKSGKESKKKGDISTGKIDKVSEISAEVNLAFMKGSRNAKPVFRSKLTRLSRRRTGI